MININNYITEKLRINSKTNINHKDCYTELLEILNPPYVDVKNYLKEWITKNKITDYIVYINIDDYKKINKRTNYNYTDVIRTYFSINDNKTEFLRDVVYVETHDNWHFIGKDAGLGFKKNYFAYVYRSYYIYIIGNPEDDDKLHDKIYNK